MQGVVHAASAARIRACWPRRAIGCTVPGRAKDNGEHTSPGRASESAGRGDCQCVSVRSHGTKVLSCLWRRGLCIQYGRFGAHDGPRHTERASIACSGVQRRRAGAQWEVEERWSTQLLRRRWGLAPACDALPGLRLEGGASSPVSARAFRSLSLCKQFPHARLRPPSLNCCQRPPS
jgi:hypothetical protein